jgi:hypothetical protein
MGSSLRDIPGAGGGKKRGRLGSVTRGPSSKPWQPPMKAAGSSRSARRSSGLRFQGPRWQVDRFNLVLALAFLALFVVGGVWLWRSNRVEVTPVGMQDGGAVRTIGVPRLEIELRVDPASRLDSATVRFEGEDVTDEVEHTDDGFIWTPPSEGLPEGDYELALEVPKTVFGTEHFSMTFGVDDTPPVIDVPEPERVGIDDALTLTGSVDERVTLTADGEPVAVAEDGGFEVTFDIPPAGNVDLIATDVAGNVSTVAVPVIVAPPSTRGLHLSADAWSDADRREGALALLDDGSVDTIVLDVKDECGVVTYASDVDVADEAGAVDERFDLAAAVEDVHDRGGRVMARLVTFRDPLLARWAWAAGRTDWVLQDGAGDPWPVYGDGEGCPEATNAEPIVGGFTNFASPEVQEYNLALAEEVTRLGVDDVLLDDVRRPDGDTSAMQAVGIEGTIVETLTGFLGQAQQRVRAEGAYLGATASSVSVRDPSFYDQDLAAMGGVVDYLSPEVYPEAYSSGFFNLADPQAAPREAVAGALNEAGEQLGERNTPFVPWLQDYSADVPYGAAEVQAQIDGAASVGVCSWVLRDPEFTYSSGLRPAC